MKLDFKRVTCSGVAVIGPDMLETCVEETGLVAGFGAGAGEVGARYLVMAGSTSGVPCNKTEHLSLHLL